MYLPKPVRLANAADLLIDYVTSAAISKHGHRTFIKTKSEE